LAYWAAWLMLKLLPATFVNAAVRLAPVFAGADTVAVPLPVPLPLTVAHPDAVEDDHAHPACVVTVTVFEPPAEVNDNEVGDTV
jgi:hypothetical protein